MQGFPLHQDDDQFSIRVAGKATAVRARPLPQVSTHAAGSGAQVPLRSRTVTARRLQLHTSHGVASMREALEKLKRSCGLFPLNDAEEMAKMDPATYMHEKSNSSSTLNRMPGQVIVHCLAYCDLASLCELARVSRRFAALSNAHHLWEAQARLRGVHVRAAESAREDLRCFVVERRERWQAEVRRHEEEYETLERRLHERTAADLAVAIDVNAALANPRLGRGADGNNREATNMRNSTTTTTDVHALAAQLEQMEAVKSELLCSVRDMKAMLTQQQKQIEELQRWITCTDEPNNNNVEKDSGVDKFTFSDVQAFERRICRVVLSAISDLPLVLKRGVDDFGTMELLCIHGAGDIGGRVRQRWSAFKRFFPTMSEDYATVRCLLMSGEAPSSERASKCLTRLSGVIRRVQKMTDNEILQIIM